MVAVELLVSLTFMTLLGRWFNLRPKQTSLLAIGWSICGSSAIIAAQGALMSTKKIHLSPSRRFSLWAHSLCSPSPSVVARCT